MAAASKKTVKNAAKSTKRAPRKVSKLGKAKTSMAKFATSKNTKAVVGFGALAIGAGFLATLGSTAAEKLVSLA